MSFTLYLKKFLLAILAAILIIEEWLWHFLTWVSHHLSRLLKLQTFDNWLRNASRYTALGAFTIPFLIILPLNLIAFHYFACAFILRGIIIEIIAKLLGTLLFARVFSLTRPQLMTFTAFATLYNTITRWLYWAHQLIHTTHIYKLSEKIKEKIRYFSARFF